MRGTGWHRCAYVLFEHNDQIEFNINQEAVDGSSFEPRVFNSKEFFSKFSQKLTPVGLSFFQTEWDLSVRNFFQKVMSKYILMIMSLLFPKNNFFLKKQRNQYTSLTMGLNLFQNLKSILLDKHLPGDYF